MSRTLDRYAVAQPFALFALTALAIGFAWWRLGAPIGLPPSPLPSGQKLYCVSYAPFRDGQDPLVEGTRVAPWQIDQDLALISKYSDCVRTYSVDDGIESVLESARRYGLRVLDGVWVSNRADKTRGQIATTIALAKKYSDVISAVIVGNEVLLRGEMSVTDLMAIIREVKAQVPEPVSYADVWEFWLRYPDLQNAVDFLTVHILPYWEDFPIPASQAAAHVDTIRKRVAAAFPGKQIVIGEFGWPSEGRIREGARPTPSNQARVIEETLALAQRENFRVNIIEAFDQPWKRWLEGPTGGYWGVFDRAKQGPKFAFGGTISDHPGWSLDAAVGVLLTALMFAAAGFAGRGKEPARMLWPTIAAMAFLPAVLLGWTVESVPVDSFSLGTWLRSVALAITAAAAPVVCAAAYAARCPLPTFASLLTRPSERRGLLHAAVGAVFIAVVLLSVQTALGLVFDPRYRDIPFAPLGAAILPFLVLRFSTSRPNGPRAAAETIAAVVLAVSAGYIVFNETFANWQAVWLCAALIGLAVTLGQARDAPG